MNVNPSSESFGDVRPWDSLTDAEKASGDWIQLPDVSDGPPRARRKTARDEPASASAFSLSEVYTSRKK